MSTDGKEQHPAEAIPVGEVIALRDVARFARALVSQFDNGDVYRIRVAWDDLSILNLCGAIETLDRATVPRRERAAALPKPPSSSRVPATHGDVSSSAPSWEWEKSYLYKFRPFAEDALRLVGDARLVRVTRRFAKRARKSAPMKSAGSTKGTK